MELPEMDGLKGIANAACKTLMATMAMQGMFSTPEAKALYRDPKTPATTRFFRLGTMFVQQLLAVPEFHSTFGPVIDEQLLQLKKELDFFFNES
ncbi:hypothetical protein [Thiomonas sp.]